MVNVKRIGQWDTALDCARYTQRKESLDKEPSALWKRRMLYAEHSPIREVRYLITVTDVPSFVIAHLVRHIHAQPYVATLREDLTGIPNEEVNRSTPNQFMWTMSVQELIHICKERLCTHASDETRECIQKIVREVGKIDPEVEKILVPKCIYRGFCPELRKCGYQNTKDYVVKRDTYVRNSM